MSIQIQGYGGDNVGAGGSAMTASKSLKVQCMPYEFGALGSYKKSLSTGTMAAGLAGGSPIFSFRVTDATRLAVVSKVTLDGLGSLTGFTAGQALFKLHIARAFTAADSGGTTGAVTGNQGKLRTSMGTALAPGIFCSTTATLTAGTRTLDTDAIGQFNYSLPVTANANFVIGSIPLFESVQEGYPIVLAYQEGLVIQATVPATGTWLSGVTISWSEVSSF